MVREYHGHTVICQNQYTYTFGRGGRRGRAQGVANDEKFVRCDSEFASRRHFEMTSNEDGDWKIKDLNSMNGTYLNATMLGFGETKILRPGDMVGVGVPAIGPYPSSVIITDRKYYVFKFVESSNRDADGFVIPLPVQRRTIPVTYNQLLTAVYDCHSRRLLRRRRRSLIRRRKELPNDGSIRISRAGTTSLSTRILLRWYSTINNHILKMKLGKAIRKLSRARRYRVTENIDIQ